MEDIKKVGFCEMTDDELLATDGGIVITTAIAIATCVSLFCAGFAGGVAMGISNKNSKRK
jgi:lactobin A/cerein 7B family class IIb bacteriocin